MCKAKLIFRAVAVVAMTLAFSPAGHADCFCELINGVMQPMCGSSLDLRPRCEATIFASEPPVAALTARPVLPPPGWRRRGSGLQSKWLFAVGGGSAIEFPAGGGAGIERRIREALWWGGRTRT